MKITMNIECWPEEARRFLGLPDVGPVHEEMMAAFKDRMDEGMAALDPEAMMRSWFGGAAGGVEEMQKRFWSQFGAGGSKDPE